MLIADFLKVQQSFVRRLAYSVHQNSAVQVVQEPSLVSRQPIAEMLAQVLHRLAVSSSADTYCLPPSLESIPERENWLMVFDQKRSSC